MNITEMLYLSAAILTCAAAFGWANVRWLRIPHTIALVLSALAVSFVALAADHLFGGDVSILLRDYVTQVHFSDTLMVGMLSFLLFAGALHVDIGRMLRYKWLVLTMATFGVLISTAIVGVAAFIAFRIIGMDISLPWCLVFGALISPTDPVAVMSILKKINLPPAFETKIAGESLLNDGVGVVVFTVMLAIAIPGPNPNGMDIFTLFLEEVVGGVALGFLGGYAAFLAMRKIDEYSVEVLITLALVTLLYSLCLTLHASGPLAVVVAGLFIGNRNKKFAMSPTTAQHVQMFWSLLDEILNSVLFLLIGFEVLVLDFNLTLFKVLLFIIPIVLLARFVSVVVPIALFSKKRYRAKGTIKILTWAGLRGGISVALALSLPEFAGRDTLILITYGVVITSIVVQGLTIERLAARWSK